MGAKRRPTTPQTQSSFTVHPLLTQSSFTVHPLLTQSSFTVHPLLTQSSFTVHPLLTQSSFTVHPLLTQSSFTVHPLLTQAEHYDVHNNYTHSPKSSLFKTALVCKQNIELGDAHHESFHPCFSLADFLYIYFFKQQIPVSSRPSRPR